MKYYFPIHLDGGNRGCEAIAKGTAQILREQKDHMIGYCTNLQIDCKLGLDKLFTLIPFKQETLSFRIKNKMHSLIIHDVIKRQNYCYAYQYNEFLDLIGDDDIMVSTGGDMFCYANCQVNYTVDYLAARRKKSVLWGCSIGKNNLTPEKIVSLNNFSAVVARESLTRQLFEDMGLKKVYQIPDPAFSLEPEKCVLPEFMNDGEVIGINFSNFVGLNVGKETLIGKNLYNLIDYILRHTSLKILFIPHVLWKDQDDRIVCNSLYEEFNKNERMFILDSDNYNYCQIRFIIANCSLFIGARTHAMISAYSTCVPAMALGYSVKSKGIAKDLGLPESTVINSTGVTSPTEMSDGFASFIANSDRFRVHLQKFMPEYKSRLSEAKQIFTEI